jgi:hypothetical protein
MVLVAADLMVFLDYAHWHLSSLLERAPLQGVGIGLYAAAVAPQVWTTVLFRKVRVEEAHLRQMFGREYETYAQHAARLVPHVY